MGQGIQSISKDSAPDTTNQVIAKPGSIHREQQNSHDTEVGATTSGSADSTGNVNSDSTPGVKPKESSSESTEVAQIQDSQSEHDIQNEQLATFPLQSDTLQPEDLRNDWHIICDGCRCTINSSGPYYYCLVCACTDYCEKCYSQPLSRKDGDMSEARITICGKDHKYIKGPMAGWKGIHDGVVHIDNKSFTTKEWLHGLKKDRWKAAWERYWLQQGGLKNILGQYE